MSITTECINNVAVFADHLVDYMVYSSDTYKRLAVAEAFAALTVRVTNSLENLGKKAMEHDEFSQVRAYTADALQIVLDVLEFYESGFTTQGLWEKMYDAFNKLTVVMQNLNSVIDGWHL